MFNKNDKSLYILRTIINVITIILIGVCVVMGIVLMAMSIDGYKFYEELFITGIVVLLVGPIVVQLIWLVFDMKYQAILDVKIIRNAQFGLEAPELPTISFKKNGKKEAVKSDMEIYDILKKYKNLLEEKIISQAEFDEIKSQLLNKTVANNTKVETTIDKIKKLKTYADENVITTEEFAEEKSKLLKK